MKKTNIDRLLLNIFQEDLNRNKKYTYISQLTILTVKSLMPMTNEKATRVDYTRFTEELKLWEQYRIGGNSSLLNIQGRVDSEVYWKERDDSILTRMIPIILANQDYTVIEEETIKTILFTTGNLDELFESLSIAYLLYLTIHNEEEVINKFKEYIIGFAQMEFIHKYNKIYKLDIKTYLGNYNVDFERKRIEILNILNGIKTGKYKNLEEYINVLDKVKGESFIGSICYDFLYSFDIDYSIGRFNSSLGEYIIKLRKSRVDPGQLKIKEYILPDIFNFNEDEQFFHSLLKESKVLKKEVREKTLTSLIQTKTGMYLFKK